MTPRAKTIHMSYVVDINFFVAIQFILISKSDEVQRRHKISKYVQNYKLYTCGWFNLPWDFFKVELARTNTEQRGIKWRQDSTRVATGREKKEEDLRPHRAGQQKKKEMLLNGLAGILPKQQDKNGMIKLWPYAPSGQESIKVR